MSSAGRTTLQAMIDAVRIEMRRDETVIYVGEGTGERGGSFGHTLGLFEEFQAHRMIDTPISELGFTGMCIGAAASGCRPIADVMFSDFLADAMTQIVNQAAKLRYMSNGEVSVPMVIWSSFGAMKSAGPHHSGSLYPWFMHIPGLKVVLPSSPADTKGLMASAIRDDDPVLFLLHKMLFSKKGEVPDGEYLVPIGKANRVREGSDVTIVATALMTHLAIEAANKLSAEGTECEVIDLRSVAPLDSEAVLKSLARTGRLLVVDEAYGPCGVGAEIAALVMERAFDLLDAPVLRIHTAFTTHPFSPVFEPVLLPQVERIVNKVRVLLEGGPRGEIDSALTSQSTHQRHNVGADHAASSTAQGAASPAPESAPEDGRLPIMIPNQGLTVDEATVTQWFVEVGEPIQKGQALFEMETEKSTADVEAEADGVLAEIVAKAGTTLPLGGIVGYLSSDGAKE